MNEIEAHYATAHDPKTGETIRYKAVTAKATDRPCQMYTYHQPVPSRTQGHHRHPVYLQNRVYGQIQDPELLWVCGTCHDSIHEHLGWLLGESRMPSPMPGRNIIREARRTFYWYRQAMADKEAGTQE